METENNHRPLYESALLNALIQELHGNNVSYCILHSYKNLPARITSDVDFCIDAAKQKDIEHILAKTCYNCNAKIIQKLHYDIPHVFYYVLSCGNLRFLRLDFLDDDIGINRYAIKAMDFLKSRRKCGKEYLLYFHLCITVLYLINVNQRNETK